METFPYWLSNPESVIKLDPSTWLDVLAYITIRDGEKAEEIQALQPI